MSEAPNILMLILDSVRADRIGSYGHDHDTMPAFDGLATEGSKFERAYATGSWTVPVHASLFTGSLPHEHGAHVKQPIFDPDSEVLAEQLTNLDYQTAAFSANPWFTEDFGFDRGFGHFSSLRPELPFGDAGDPRDREWDPSADRTERAWEVLEWLSDGNPVKRFANGFYLKKINQNHRAPGSLINDAALDWILDRSGADPYFVCMNYMDAHEPYRIHEEYLDNEKPISPEVKRVSWNHKSLIDPPPENLATDLIRVYDASLSVVDEHIRDLLDRLKQHDQMENTLIVLLGDHGQALGESGYWGHGTFLHEPLLRVPLLIYHQDSSLLPDSIVGEPVSLTSLPAYLTRIADLSLPGTSDISTSECVLGTDEEEKPVYAESYGLDDERLSNLDLPASKLAPDGYTAVVYRGWKGIHNRTTGDIDLCKCDSSFDAKRSEVEETIRKLLLDKEPSTKVSTDSPELDPAVVNRLKRLGYR